MVLLILKSIRNRRVVIRDSIRDAHNWIPAGIYPREMGGGGGNDKAEY